MARSSRIRKDEENQDNSSQPWLTTYADMVQLLLTFFIMLISFSTINQIKFQMAAISLRGAFGVMKKYPAPRNEVSFDYYTDQQRIRKQAIDDMQKIQKKLAEMGMKDQLTIHVTDDGLLIRMGEKILFDLGKADIRPEAYPILEMVGKSISQSASNIIVSGHTDDLPINTVEFPSNWELSTARAVNVVRYFVEKVGVDPKSLGATGYSEFRPVVPNDSPENRQRNRRVEFLVSWQKP
jgi:chemotaxis protein MotB